MTHQLSDVPIATSTCTHDVMHLRKGGQGKQMVEGAREVWGEHEEEPAGAALGRQFRLQRSTPGTAVHLSFAHAVNGDANGGCRRLAGLLSRNLSLGAMLLTLLQLRVKAICRKPHMYQR